jgi:hypothetical protein
LVRDTREDIGWVAFRSPIAGQAFDAHVDFGHFEAARLKAKVEI